MPIKPEPSPAEPVRRRRFPRWLVISLSAAALLAALLGASSAYIIHIDLPDVRSLEDYRPPTITRILARDGEVVHQFAEQKRIVVPLSRVSQHLQDAVIAIEDANFRSHVGVDPKAVVRALLRDIRLRRWEEGGSTITQQLTKLLFFKPEKTVRRKLQEARLAVQIERTYTKEEIFEFYLNQIYMGHGRYGVESAARFYFDLPASALNLEQSALLAGLIQRPEAYSPLRSPERAMKRRNRVLERMAVEGFITPEEASLMQDAPIEVARNTVTDDSLAPYFAEEIRKTLVDRYGEEALLRQGLVIQTGLDPDLQRAANRALSDGLRALDKRRGFRRPSVNVVLDKLGDLVSYRHPGWDRVPQAGDLVTGLVTQVSRGSATIRVGPYITAITPADAEWTGQKNLLEMLRPGDLTLFEVVSLDDAGLSLKLDQEPEVEGALLALDPRTGDIRAMAGGFDFNRSQFNRATQALRQCGSAFKPFIYAAAVEDGYRPSDLLIDEPTVFADDASGYAYQPENYERRYHGVVTLRRSLEESINVPTVALLNKVGYARTVEFAHKLGIGSRLFPYPSLALGSSEVSLMELTASYGVFPSGGIHTTPRYYSEVSDPEGKVLEEIPIQSAEVLGSGVSAVMVSMLEGVVERGTAESARRPGVALAGKTGTTDDYTDAWFIGFSPSLVVGVWVGHDTKTSLGSRETGAKAALPIWSGVMDAWLERHPNENFLISPDVVTLPVDRDTGLRAAKEAGCSQVIMETFIKGSEIERPCTYNAHLRLSLPYYLQRYRIMGEGQIQIDDDLDRLLRENPHELELLAGGTRLSVITPGGARVVRLGGNGNDAASADVSWGLLAAPAAPKVSSAEELAYTQLLPAELPPIGTGLHPYLGLDGRSAAVIRILYP